MPIASARGGSKQRWSTDEMHVLRMLNQESEFGSTITPSDQPQLFLAIFPYMRGQREYDESQLRDTWKHCHSKGRGKAWLRAVRPNKVEEDGYTDEEKARFKVLRGWIVAAAEAIGVKLTGIDGLEAEAARQHFLEQMKEGLAKVASEAVDDGDDEDDEHAAGARDAQVNALPPTEIEAASQRPPPAAPTRSPARRTARANRPALSALQDEEPQASRSPAVDHGQNAPLGARQARLGKRARSAQNEEDQAKPDATVASLTLPASKRARRTSETSGLSIRRRLLGLEESQEEHSSSKTAANTRGAHSRAATSRTEQGRSGIHDTSAQRMEPNEQQPTDKATEKVSAQVQAQSTQDGPPTPLPMVHWSHLQFQPDGVFYRPTHGHSAISAEAGFVDQASAMYRYGGPVVSLKYVPGPKQPAHEARSFDAMVCLKDMCNTCRPEHPLAVMEQHISNSPFLGLPAVHLIDVAYSQENLRFIQKPGRVIPSQDGWLFSARNEVRVLDLLFTDGAKRKVAVCAGVDCKTCQSQSTLASYPNVGEISNKQQAPELYSGYQSLIPTDSDTPRLLQSNVQRGVPLMMVHCRDVQMANGILVFTPHSGGVATDDDGFVPVGSPTFKFGGPAHLVQVPFAEAQSGYGDAHLQLCAKERCIACTVPPDNDALPEGLLGPGAPVVHHIDCNLREDGLLRFAPQHARDYSWIMSLEEKDVVFGDGKARRARICAGPYGPMSCGVCRAESGYVPPQPGDSLPMVHSRYLSERDSVTLFAPPPRGLEGNEDMDDFGLVKQHLPLYQHGGYARRVHYTVGGQAVDVQACDLAVCRGCNQNATGLLWTRVPRPPVVRRRFCTLRQDGLLEFTPEEGGNDTAEGGLKESEVVFADGMTRRALIADDPAGLCDGTGGWIHSGRRREGHVERRRRLVKGQQEDTSDALSRSGNFDCENSQRACVDDLR